MTQWRLARGEHSARARMVSRAAAVVMALGVALFCAGGSAKAEPHPVRIRHAAAARQTDIVQTGRTKFRSGGEGPRAGKGTARDTSSKGVAQKGNQARGSAKRAQSKADATTSNAGARAKTRRHEKPSRADGNDPPPFYRASATGRRGERQGRRVAYEIAAPAPSRYEAVPAAAEVKPLTVNDFVRAASAPPAPASEIYASGESHPDEDDSVDLPRAALSRAATPAPKPLPAKRPVVMARVEAAPAESAPEPNERTAPSDLVGAPDAAPERSTRIAETRDETLAAGLRAPTRQELTEEVEQPVVLPGLYRNGRLVMPAPLKGTREILVHQNLMADDEGLQRIQDDYDLRRMRAMRQLVDFPESASLHVNPELAGDRRCARPWTVRFASDTARAFYARFHQPLQVNSAVRTVAYQVRLQRVNGNAAGIDGDMASPHLTGQALDFGKRGMSTEQIAWMRMYLLPLMQAGKLDVEEEFQQSCFHISVYRTYFPNLTNLPATRRRSAARSEVAQLHEPRVPKVSSRADLDQ